MEGVGERLQQRQSSPQCSSGACHSRVSVFCYWPAPRDQQDAVRLLALRVVAKC